MNTKIKDFPIQTADGTIYGLYLHDGKIQINKGSFFRTFDVPSLTANYRNIRTFLINNGYIDLKKGTLIKNFVFSSPSEAICCSIGGMESGNRKFFTSDNVELGVYLSKIESHKIERYLLNEDDKENTISTNDIDLEPADIKYEPIKKPNLRESSGSSFQRNVNVSKNAIKIANYKCELNNSHKTFVTASEKPYVEAHHLIPLSCQNDFDYSLDVETNIIRLCPNCHRMLHYGLDIRSELRKLYNARKNFCLSVALIYHLINWRNITNEERSEKRKN